jgi:hypothetical protein
MYTYTKVCTVFVCVSSEPEITTVGVDLFIRLFLKAQPHARTMNRRRKLRPYSFCYRYRNSFFFIDKKRCLRDSVADPGFFRIRIFQPDVGSRAKKAYRISDPGSGSAIRNLSIFNPKDRY